MGLLGVPLGALVLTRIEVELFKLGLGSLLILYTTHRLFVRSITLRDHGGWLVEAFVGFAGGVLGWLAGLSGPLPTIWADLQDWTKAEKRKVIQIFNLTILSTVLVAHGIGGLLTNALVISAFVALPGTALGAVLGYLTYLRMSDAQFANLILVLLGFSGVILIASVSLS